LADLPLLFVKNTRNTPVFLRFCALIKNKSAQFKLLCTKTKEFKMSFGALRLQPCWRKAKAKTTNIA